MRKNFGPEPICYPMPVYIIGTYNEDGTPNAMNAAWGGITGETHITICVDSEHKTAENLLARKAFTVSMATAKYMAACDYVGITSGNTLCFAYPYTFMEKFKKTKLLEKILFFRKLRALNQAPG